MGHLAWEGERPPIEASLSTQIDPCSLIPLAWGWGSPDNRRVG
jgi:hypothetical protein